MPEYLSPGVYTEEVDTGNKPIEGVSTSTAAMLGMTERGPVNVPILITSYGEYRRWFGERLRADDFRNAMGLHCYLPHAVEGFFTNEGKRVFITRVLNTETASRALFVLHDRGTSQSAMTMLLRPANEMTGIGASPIYVLNVNQVFPDSGPLNVNDEVRIGSGSDAEYRVVASIGAPASETHVSLSYAISFGHDAAAPVTAIPRTPINLGGALAVSQNAGAGTRTVMVTGPAAAIAAAVALPTGGQTLLEIGTPLCCEHRFLSSVASVDPTHAQLALDSPLILATPATTAVVALDATVAGTAGVLDLAAQAGDAVVYVTGRPAQFADSTSIVVFENAGAANREARRNGALCLLTVSSGAYAAYPQDTAIQGVTLVDDGATPAKSLTAASVPNASVIALDNRTNLAVGDVLRIGPLPNQEYATILALPNPSPGNAAPNAGNVLLAQRLNGSYPNGTVVRRESPPILLATRPGTALVLPTSAGGTFLAVSDGGVVAPPTTFAANDIIRVTTSTGGVFYHALSAGATALTARPVALTVPLSDPHALGAVVAARQPLANVQAIDAGAWGNRLRISVEDEPGLVSNSFLTQVITLSRIKLSSTVGVEPGTILELQDPKSGVTIGDPIKVVTVDRTKSEATLNPGLSLAQSNAAAALPPGTFLRLRSREFRITVRLLRQPDPAIPTRNEIVLDSEVFPNLSMDSRHSRYFQTIIGDTNGPHRLSDRRPEGESWYVRVHDHAQDLAEPARTQTLESIRLGPEALVDILPSGRTQAARHPLDGGDDAINSVTDLTYIGQDDVNPEKRTGLYSFVNVDEVSIVAIPGRNNATIQGAVIDHCEQLLYRFAVLDGPPPPDDALADVQQQRQQFDTKYAALYHPWLLIEDPFPTNLANISDFPIPPSGHVVGIYARTDIERGVHKAPANEVVSGILGLQRILNKGEQDILNPYPVNINVIRDFRPDNRSIRVWGGRVITSDTDWKYVNVRRLLIFIEKSIDRGLQWVVFEPNAEPLWARVRRTISNFLTTVWRNGALEGTKPEEAYFVKCDRTTMTQTDIDNGKLIVVIGVAPVKPAEFVIIRIGLWTANASS